MKDKQEPPALLLFRSPAAFAMGDRYFTVMKNGLLENVLWITDGTGNGTSSVRTGLINGVPNSFESVHSLRKLDSDLYFIANSPNLPAPQQWGLWKLASNSNTPARVATNVASLGQIVRFADKVVFNQGGLSPLWQLEPANSEGKIAVPGTETWIVAEDLEVVNVGGVENLRFVANGTSGAGIYRIQTGAAVATLLLNDLYLFGSFQFESVLNGNTTEVFLKGALNSGPRIWRIAPNGSALNVTAVTVDGNEAFFADTIRPVGNKLLLTEGGKLRAVTAGNNLASLVRDFSVSGSITQDMQTVDFADGPRLLFKADGSGQTGSELWISDGTPTDTRMVVDLNRTPAQDNPRNTLSSDPSVALGAMLGDYFYFSAVGSVGSGRELYRTNGTEAGTQLFKEIRTGANGSGPFDGLHFNSRLAAGSSKLLFTGYNLWTEPRLPELQFEVFSSDGTEVGTRRITENLGMTLTAEALFREGDYRINADDLSDVPRVTTSTSVTASSGLVSIDTSEAVREALRTGKTHLTIRLSTPDRNVSLSIRASRYDASGGVIGPPPDVSGPPLVSETGLTRLQITPIGVLMDVYDSDGRIIAKNKSVTDMRNMDAGQLAEPGSSLARITSLKFLYLDRNNVSDVGMLIGETKLARPQTGPAWTRNIHNTLDADGGDYAWIDGTTASSADNAYWVAVNLLPGTYEVWTTWLSNSDRATSVTYSMYPPVVGGVAPQVFSPVNQRFAPNDSTLVGNPWQKLGQFDFVAGMHPYVHFQISAQGDGIGIADGLRLVRTVDPLPNLKELSLLENPLRNDSRDGYLITLDQYEIMATPFPEVAYTADLNGP